MTMDGYCVCCSLSRDLSYRIPAATQRVRRKDKGKYIPDEGLRIQWEKDRLKKAEQKRLREEKRRPDNNNVPRSHVHTKRRFDDADVSLAEMQTVVR